MNVKIFALIVQPRGWWGFFFVFIKCVQKIEKALTLKNGIGPET